MRNVIENWILHPLLEKALSGFAETYEEILKRRGEVVVEVSNLLAQGRFEELFQAMDKEKLLDRLKMKDDLLDDPEYKAFECFYTEARDHFIMQTFVPQIQWLKEEVQKILDGYVKKSSDGEYLYKVGQNGSELVFKSELTPEFKQIISQYFVLYANIISSLEFSCDFEYDTKKCDDIVQSCSISKISYSQGPLKVDIECDINILKLAKFIDEKVGLLDLKLNAISKLIEQRHKVLMEKIDELVQLFNEGRFHEILSTMPPGVKNAIVTCAYDQTVDTKQIKNMAIYIAAKNFFYTAYQVALNSCKNTEFASLLSKYVKTNENGLLLVMSNKEANTGKTNFIFKKHVSQNDRDLINNCAMDYINYTSNKNIVHKTALITTALEDLYDESVMGLELKGELLHFGLSRDPESSAKSTYIIDLQKFEQFIFSLKQEVELPKLESYVKELGANFEKLQEEGRYNTQRILEEVANEKFDSVFSSANKIEFFKFIGYNPFSTEIKTFFIELIANAIQNFNDSFISQKEKLVKGFCDTFKDYASFEIRSDGLSIKRVIIERNVTQKITDIIKQCLNIIGTSIELGQRNIEMKQEKSGNIVRLACGVDEKQVVVNCSLNLLNFERFLFNSKGYVKFCLEKLRVLEAQEIKERIELNRCLFDLLNRGEFYEIERRFLSEVPPSSYLQPAAYTDTLCVNQARAFFQCAFTSIENSKSFFDEYTTNFFGKYVEKDEEGNLFIDDESNGDEENDLYKVERICSFKQNIPFAVRSLLTNFRFEEQGESLKTYVGGQVSGVYETALWVILEYSTCISNQVIELKGEINLESFQKFILEREAKFANSLSPGGRY